MITIKQVTEELAKYGDLENMNVQDIKYTQWGERELVIRLEERVKEGYTREHIVTIKDESL